MSEPQKCPIPSIRRIIAAAIWLTLAWFLKSAPSIESCEGQKRGGASSGSTAGGEQFRRGAEWRLMRPTVRRRVRPVNRSVPLELSHFQTVLSPLAVFGGSFL